MLFFFDQCLPIGEIQHPFGIRNVFNVSFRYLVIPSNGLVYSPKFLVIIIQSDNIQGSPYVS